MVFPNLLWSACLFCLLSTAWRCEATSVVTCMLCTVVSEPLEQSMNPTAMVNAMFRKCDNLGLMEPICEKFVSENAKEIFQRIRQGATPSAVCQGMEYCDA